MKKIQYFKSSKRKNSHNTLGSLAQGCVGRKRRSAKPTHKIFRRSVHSAHKSFPEIIKQVKNQIKNPLSDKRPVILLQFAEIKKTETSFVLLDEQGKQIPLADIPYLSEPTTHLLPMLNKTFLQNQAVLVMFEHNWRHNRLEAQPLSIVTTNEVVRFLY